MLFKIGVMCLCFCGFVFAQDLQGSDAIVVMEDINSTVDKVWQVLIDFKNYDKWNSWYRVEGVAKEGATVQAYDDLGSRLDLKITKIDENTLCWTDVSWFTNFGLGGWRCRTVMVNPDGAGVRLINHFEYSGPFRFILELATRKILLDGITLENKNLKAFVEK